MKVPQGGTQYGKLGDPHPRGVLTLIAILCVIGFFGSGAGKSDPAAMDSYTGWRKATGGQRGSCGPFSIQWLSMRNHAEGFSDTRKGTSGGRSPSLGRKKCKRKLQIDSFLGGEKVSLKRPAGEKNPKCNVRVAKDGSTNMPAPGGGEVRGSNKTAARIAFSISAVRRVNIEDGWILYNEVIVPLAVKAGAMSLVLDAGGTAEHPLYFGNLEWQGISKFHRTPNGADPRECLRKIHNMARGITLEQGVLSAGRSHLGRAGGDVRLRKNRKWKFFDTRGGVELLDFRETFRSPLTPTGHVDVRGEGALADGQYKGNWQLHGTGDIHLNLRHFPRPRGSQSRGSYNIDNYGLVVPDFLAEIFGGTVTGKVTLAFSLEFSSVQTLISRTYDLRGYFPAIEHPGFSDR